jgi:cation:H+ antiporter
VGIPNFVFVQWVAPFVSEFPEKVSAFYWARTVERASMALMNMVSSNINQWTLLAAMLPIVYSMSRGTPSTIPLDSQQELELLLTLGQSLLSAVFLLNMRLAWWEAAGLFGLWIVQFAFTTAVHDVVTAIYFVWAAVEIGRVLTGRSSAPALRLFGEMWRRHVR